MKKRVVYINLLVLVSSLVLFLVSSMIIVNHTNTRNMETEIRSYLALVENSYDGTNMEEVANQVHQANSKIRVTFISEAGDVLYDTSSISEEDHLSRPELKDLGTVVHRYSQTTRQNMFYVACYLNSYNTFIRVSMPESSIKDMSNVLLSIGVLIIIVICIVSYIIFYYVYKKGLLPLKKEILKLNDITGNDIIYDNSDLIMLSEQVDKTRDMIEEIIQTTQNEKNKIEYIIENINSGLLVVNGQDTVILINKLACEILSVDKSKVINKPYIYSIVDQRLSINIENCRNRNESISANYEQNGKEYLVNFVPLDSEFAKVNGKLGVFLYFFDITESKKIEKIKLNFFANASHELKSPLTSIIGYQQMIKEGIISSKEDVAEAMECTIKEANRMDLIIKEMLELSYLESGKSDKKEDLDVRDKILEIVNAYKIYLANKNISCQISDETFICHISQNDLEHLLRNIIDNAIKYNVDNGNITIKIDAIRKEISIIDTGIGINNEDLDRIFERFYRVDKAKSKENGGTGLGLAIVKHICINNNIKIKVNSCLGKGTEFILFF